jgi:predicted nucleic acid-binding protein
VTVFVDTSALYALLDRDDDNHSAASETFAALLEQETLVTHNYVLVETTALVHHRLGGPAARAFIEDVMPVLRVVFVNEDLHRGAESAFLAALRRRVSFVDWVSFELMRRAGIDQAFAFDRDFDLQGFRSLP